MFFEDAVFIMWSATESKDPLELALTLEELKREGQLERFLSSSYAYSFATRCIQDNFVEGLTIFLDVGLRIESIDEYNWTLLFSASEKGCISSVQYLIQQGANINVRGSDGYTPLMVAAEEGHTEIVKLLLSSGATFLDNNSFGLSALHFACRSGVLTCVETLVHVGSDIQAKCELGQTPLDVAIKYEKYHIAQYLKLKTAG